MKKAPVACGKRHGAERRLRMHRTNSGPILQAALEYHRRGFSVLPIKPGTKRPACRSWKPFQSERPDERRLHRWFSDHPDRGLAVVLGDVSGGLVCRDFDTMESYQRWVRDHPDLAKMLPTVATARGRHVYFHSDHRGIVHLEDGELRGAGYCLLPPSRHPDGPVYRWLVPLPDGPLPFVENAHEAGFLPKNETQKAQKTQKAQEVPRSPRKSQVMEGGEGEAKKNAPQPDRAAREAIERTIPPGPGQRRDKLFELARRLKAIPEFADLPTTEIDPLKPYLRRWWKRAKPNTSGTHPRFEQSWKDFVFAWEEARIPHGATMQELFELAREAAPPTKAVEKYGAGSLRTLLACLCRELQHFHGGDRFYLSGRAAAPLLGISDVQAWRWLNTLERDGIIRLLKTYPRGTRMAREYRYVGE